LVQKVRSLEEEIAEVQAWVDSTIAKESHSCGPVQDDIAAAADFAHCEQLLFHGPDGRGAGVLSPRMTEVSRLGYGTYGVVFRARDCRLGREVAIKVLRPSAREIPSLPQRFELEGTVLARCGFEGILPVYEVGTIEGLPYLVTRLASGPNLAEYLEKQTEPLPVRLAVSLMVKVAEAVHEAHQQGILHRDLKPSNILTEALQTTSEPDAFRVFVCDFGLAKDFSQPQRIQSEELGQQLVGTVRYMSPEQVLGNRGSISVASDLFSLGVILYEMLTLQHPFEGESRIDLLHRIAYADPAPIPRWNRRIPRDVIAIVDKCLRKDPSERYRNLAEFADDLRAWQAGKPVQARSSSAAERIWLFLKRNPVTTLLSLLLVTSIAVGGGTAGTYFVDNREKMRIAQMEALRADENSQFALRALRSYQVAAEKLLLDAPQSNQKKLELHLESLPFYQEHAARHNYDEKSLHLLGVAHHYIANAAQNALQRDLERKHREEHYAIAKRLVEAYPENASYHFDLFMNRLLCGNWLYSETTTAKNLNEAREHLERAIELSPENSDYREALVKLELDVAALTRKSDPDLYEARLLAALAIAEENVARYPDRPRGFDSLVLCLNELAARRFDAPLEAKRLAERALHLEETQLTRLEERHTLGMLKLQTLRLLFDIAVLERSMEWEARLEDFVAWCIAESERDQKYRVYRIDAAQALLDAAENCKEGALSGDWQKLVARSEALLEGFEPQVPEHQELLQKAINKRLQLQSS